MTPDNNTEQEIAALDQQIKDARPQLDLAAALERLRVNPDFKKLVVEGYLKNEAVRLVHLKADPNMSAPQHQAAIVRDIDSIGALAQFFATVDAVGRRAERAIAEAEQMREEILAEGK